MTNNDNASERIVPLVEAALDALRLAETVPYSPVSRVLDSRARREFRRQARRLRERQPNVELVGAHTADELADVLERTVRRDEITEQARRDFNAISQEIDRAHEENRAEVEKALKRFTVETWLSAAEAGPGSAAAERFRLLGMLYELSGRANRRERRQRGSEAVPLLPGEPIIPIPPEDRDPLCGRVLVRIQVGETNWIGAFERGHTTFSAVTRMPGRKHTLVVEGGAAYQIDWMTRTLVDTLGSDVIGLMGDEANTVLFVDHAGRSLEAFGWNGRLWHTDEFSCGGFRNCELTEDGLAGEARTASAPGWAPFVIDVETGSVRFGEPAAAPRPANSAENRAKRARWRRKRAGGRE